MSINLLFVEDNPHKRARITEFLKTLPFDFNIQEAYSFTSCCQKMETSRFSIILADISLPTYDKQGSESGGRFRPFAGREIGRKLMRKRASEKILFITQYESFSDKGTSYSFDDLAKLLSEDCGDNFLGMIFYDSSRSAWKDALANTMKEKIK